MMNISLAYSQSFYTGTHPNFWPHKRVSYTRLDFGHMQMQLCVRVILLYLLKLELWKLLDNRMESSMSLIIE